MNMIKTVPEKSGRSLGERGFSLIDVVVTVAIIVALSVGGFISYNALVNNSKQGAVDYASSNVYKSALVYESDGNDSTDACSAVKEYNDSSEGIDVKLIVPGPDPEIEADYTYYPAASGEAPYTGCAV